MSIMRSPSLGGDYRLSRKGKLDPVEPNLGHHRACSIGKPHSGRAATPTRCRPGARSGGLPGLRLSGGVAPC